MHHEYDVDRAADQIVQAIERDAGKGLFVLSEIEGYGHTATSERGTTLQDVVDANEYLIENEICQDAMQDGNIAFLNLVVEIVDDWLANNYRLS